jgi:hypothetical protein
MNRIGLCLVLLAFAALIFAGCQSAKPDLAAMGKAMSDAKSYRMTTVASGAEVNMEIECPDKVHTTTKAGSITSEVVMIGTTTYMQIKTSTATITYSDWNKVQVQEPKI